MNQEHQENHPKFVKVKIYSERFGLLGHVKSTSVSEAVKYFKDNINSYFADTGEIWGIKEEM